MTIPTLTAPPVAPSRSNPPATFITRMNAFLAWIVVFAGEIIAMVAATNDAIGTIIADRIQTGQDRIAAAASAAAASASALTALNAPGTTASSVTPVDLSALNVNDELTITIQTGKALIPGHMVVVAVTTNAIFNFMARVMAYNSGSGALDLMVMAEPVGTGSHSAWSVALTCEMALPTATAAEIWAGTAADKAISPASRSAANAIQTLTDGATINWNAATQGFHAKVVLGGNRTLATPTNMLEGEYYVFYPVQPATGGPRLCALPGVWDFGQQGTPTLSTGANKMDAVRLQCVNATTQACKATFVKAG